MSAGGSRAGRRVALACATGARPTLVSALLCRRTLVLKPCVDGFDFPTTRE